MYLVRHNCQPSTFSSMYFMQLFKSNIQFLVIKYRLGSTNISNMVTEIVYNINIAESGY